MDANGLGGVGGNGDTILGGGDGSFGKGGEGDLASPVLVHAA